MYSQTSGCIRNERSRKSPMSSATVCAVAEEVLEHGAARVARVHALRHLRELHRVAEQHERLRARPERERVGERGLARLVDEEVVERRRRAPRA